MRGRRRLFFKTTPREVYKYLCNFCVLAILYITLLIFYFKQSSLIAIRRYLLDKYETQIKFKDRNNTLSEFKNRDDTHSQIRGTAMNFTLFYKEVVLYSSGTRTCVVMEEIFCYALP